jgi:hypothetical protein
MVSIYCLFYAAATHIHKQDRQEWKRWIRVHLVHILQSSLRATPFKSTNTSACIRRHLQIPLAQCQKKADVESRVKYIFPLWTTGVLPCSNSQVTDIKYLPLWCYIITCTLNIQWTEQESLKYPFRIRLDLYKIH